MIQPELAHPADFDEITEVWEASVKATHSFLTEADIEYFKPLVRNEFLGMVQLYIYRNPEGKITGFVGTLGKKIEMLFIHPGEFGKGIGKELLHFACRELHADEVDVNEQNEKAVGFYTHLGFKVMSRSPLDAMGKPFPILHLKRLHT